MNIEQRQHPRFDVVAQVKVELDDEIHIMEVANLSESGVLVLTEYPEHFYWIRIGERLEIDVSPTDEPENIHIEGLIVRIHEAGEASKRGFAMMFVDVSDGTREELRRLIDQNRA